MSRNGWIASDVPEVQRWITEARTRLRPEMVALVDKLMAGKPPSQEVLDLVGATLEGWHWMTLHEAYCQVEDIIEDALIAAGHPYLAEAEVA